MPPNRSVDVQTFLNENPFSPYQWVTFALCFFIVLLDGFDTAAIGYIAPSLITEWGVQRPALAPVLSAALFGLAFGALSSGPLADRFGRKKVLVGSGLSVENLARFADAHGFIVGSSLKQGGIWSNPLDRMAVESMARAFAKLT